MSCGCITGLVSLLSGPTAMLPEPSYQQEGTKCTIQHRSARRGTKRLQRVYRVSTDTLGSGSFGTVRKTWSRETGAPCVLKTVPKTDLQLEDLRDLANEIAIHEMCDHPNIARIFESFEDPDNIHIAMEVCEGGEMHQFLREQGCLPEGDARIAFQQVMQAVRYLHEVKHVAHRDLKLENLLLKFADTPVEQNVIKLIDFGFARSFVPGKDSMRVAVGTPVYMAPEIIRGPYSEKCDIWSCGVLLHEFISGFAPFDHFSPQRIFHLAAVQPLCLEGGVWDEVSGSVKDLLRSLLSKAPETRASAAEALDHAWFQNMAAEYSSGSFSFSLCSAASSDVSMEEITENLRAFSLLSDFEKAALRLAAYRLDDPEVADQRNIFKLLDTNGDGLLSVEELGAGCPELAQADIAGVDVDGSGVIEYSEFLGAAVRRDKLPGHACWEAFRILDKDGSGLISPEEAQDLVLSHCRSGSPAASPTESLSLGDEDIDFEGFVSMLRRSGSGGA